jgi:hypothetical protein
LDMVDVDKSNVEAKSFMVVIEGIHYVFFRLK